MSALGVALQPTDKLHSELDIPHSPSAPYSLQLLLDMFRDQYLSFITRLNTPEYANEVRQQIDKEKVCFPRSIVHTNNVYETTSCLQQYTFSIG